MKPPKVPSPQKTKAQKLPQTDVRVRNEQNQFALENSHGVETQLMLID